MERAEKNIITAIRILGGLTDIALILIISLFAVYSIYSIWDDRSVVQEALPEEYETYKPRDDISSFAELQRINPDVTAWLNLYGTNIDYPVLHSDDDWKYVSRDVRMRPSMTGSIFLSSLNSPDFSDFNSIIYGHNMTPQVMFGGIKEFKAQDYFRSHRYGDLYSGGKHYGIEIFGILKADAYDDLVYEPGITDPDEKVIYLDRLLTRCRLRRDVNVSEEDRILLLSTCSNEGTNERDILLGRLSDESFDNPFAGEDEAPKTGNMMKLLMIGAAFLTALLLVAILIIGSNKRK